MSEQWSWKHYDLTTAVLYDEAGTPRLFHDGSFGIRPTDARLIAAAPEMARWLELGLEADSPDRVMDWRFHVSRLLARIRGDA